MATTTENAASHLIFGVGNWNNDPANLSKQEELLASHGESEKFLGNHGLASSGEFNIITKAPMCLVANGATKEGILQQWEKSSKALKTNKVAIYLLHVPDDQTPIEETMDGIQTLYEAGHFDEFGISNFSPTQVVTLHTYCCQKSYILPTIYQCLYSPCSRLSETHLFPLLHSLNIKIQAYSCLASGFLTKNPEDIKEGKGNFDRATVFGKVLQEMYVEEVVREIAKGPLEEWVVDRIEALWEDVRGCAKGDNFQTYRRLLELGAL
ncbi:hypothetical protein EG329_006439 [Mollisiaceae sp. DMI_Dod_QoI]|nr:hypothetical protein EG329_006439 [Helotiales sp. DMI_Dod_QoI]